MAGVIFSSVYLYAEVANLDICRHVRLVNVMSEA